MTRPLPPFELERYFSRWEFTARYHLCASDMQALSLAELLELADADDRAAWDALTLGYTETLGAPALREAIAATYEAATPADILCAAGAEEGIFVAMHALLSSDDHAIAITPNYQSLESVAASLCETTGIPLDPDRHWRLDLDRVRDAMRPNTRLIAINFPHNPTGAILPLAEFDALIAMARERQIFVFSDEVYRGIERDPARRLPAVVDRYERGLSLGVMSKTYGLAGIRIGWIACRDPMVLARMHGLKHYLSICNAAPSERLAIIALKARSHILARNRAIIARNLPVLEGFFADHRDRFEWDTPDGGCIGYPRYRGVEGVETFACDLVERSGVLVLPASIYRSALGPTPTDRFRIGFGREGLAAGLAVMRDHLAPVTFH
jgi:aspartate/methionine/tyrosine aminotransferase